MDHTLKWTSEEEGIIIFSEQDKPVVTLQFFDLGDEEAEFRIQEIVFPKEIEENGNIPDKITQKVTECVLIGFGLLWAEGLIETVLVAEGGSRVAEILGSTKVVHLWGKEWMMNYRLEPQKSTDCGLVDLTVTETGEGLLVENKKKTFSCRIMEHKAETPEEKKFYLYEVEVKKRKRNRGIATACLTELFRYLSKDGPVTVSLQVGSYNEPAVHLYQKLGFTVCQELQYYRTYKP